MHASTSQPAAGSVTCPALALLAVAFLGLVAGCSVVKTTAEAPAKAVNFVATGGKEKPRVDPVELQQVTLRFADEFLTHMILGVDKLRRGTNAIDGAEVLKWKVAFASETTSIASGPSAIGNLLDLTVFVTVTHAALEEHWQPKVFGDSAAAMLAGARQSESNLWQLAGKVLSPGQQRELRAAIVEWRRQNPMPEVVIAARAVSFAMEMAQASPADSAKPGSVFSLLMIDPLSGLDPAAREIAQARLFAERALYVTQKMPMLLRWQTELLSVNATRLPAIQQLITNSTQLTTSIESFARIADQLPKLVNDQREAAIQQVFTGLATERTNLLVSLAAEDVKLRGTLTELRQTLSAGGDMAKSVDGAVKSLDTFIGRFDKGTNTPPPATNARPFDILDYATAAKEITATVKELNTAINSVDHAVPQIRQAGETMETAGNRLLGRLFLVGAGLIVLLLAGVLIAVLVYRKLTGKNPTSTSGA